MIIFPFIEKIAEWVEKQGGYIYWIWVICVGIVGAVAIRVWADHGFDAARWLLIVVLVVYLGGIYPVMLAEEKRKRNK